MQEFEKLGVFYLGRQFDLPSGQAEEDLLLFESKHLVTHGLIVGMTGSGKTGLCSALIEEAALDGIPSLLIDPKGDLTNLLLTFPDLKAEDFLPWVSEEDARRHSLALPDHAARQAETWRQGLARWGQDGDRIRRLRQAADFAIYTPGSSAGLPISILSSFAPPESGVADDPELLGERVTSTVASLLGLLGIPADPVKSRESILLSTLLQKAWMDGRHLDLAGLIQEIQQPSVTRAGVLDLDTFYPQADRFALAMQVNNLLASPRFAAWSQGPPLDIQQLLYTSSGQPRVAILSIAHLGDAERMFFVTLLLNQVLAWMRGQSGTNSLRALLYMDEIFGYFPPVANPPSKVPLLTLLKQARAYGLGVVLATQNPVDLDYKGLANIGTWCIGRLQTERDKARVLEGLEGAAVGRGESFDRAALEQTLAGLRSRVFLLHSVHQSGFEIFESRWAMSYLRGPLSREQIKRLTVERQGAASAAPAPATTVRPPETAPAPAQRLAARPVLPPQVPQFFLPRRHAVKPGASMIYRARLLGAAQVRFVHARSKVDVSEPCVVMTEITDRAVPVDWEAAEELSVAVEDLDAAPEQQAEYSPLAPAAAQPKNYEKWSKDFAAWIYRARRLSLHHSASLGLTSRPGEEERDFRIRLQQAAHEQRDAAVETLRQKYAPKLAALQERLRRAQAARERESAQARRAKLDTVISFGSTLLGAFLGRKAVSAGTLGKAATTMRGVTRSLDQATDVTRAAETVEAVQQQLTALDAEFKAESERISQAFDSSAQPLETIELAPNKSNIQVSLVALVWVPT